jgi:nitroreductase
MLKEIEKRRSIRSFSSKVIPEDVLYDILEAGANAPQSKHNKSLEYIIVKDSIDKKYLYELLGQGYLKDAPVLIIPLINQLKSTSSIEDISVATQNIFLQAYAHGLGSVWKKIAKEYRQQVIDYFNIPKDFYIINIIPVGYPKVEKLKKKDKDFSKKKIHIGRW